MKKFKIEYLVYIFIILTPFLDAFSFLYRENFKTADIAWISLIRPIIPLILFIYIFLKDKKIRGKSIIFSSILLLYGLGHLWLFKENLNGIAIGNIMQEAHYILNYSYMIYLLFIINYLYQKDRLPFLKKALFYMLISYLVIIYISILTKTSYTTYLDGIGFRSWFISGNSLGTVLLMLVTITLPTVKRVWEKISLVLIVIYLAFLLGTRTGMLGIILVITIFLGLKLNEKFNFLKVFNLKKIIVLSLILIISISSISFIGLKTLKRRQNLNDLSNMVIDVNTGKVGHTTGDTATLVLKIKNLEITEDYMDKNRQKAYLEMYRLANKYEIKATNLRLQQLIYQIELFKVQKDIKLLLLGNGYLNHYGEMILEMDILAFFFNFGILGFILYFIPFLYLFIKGCKEIIKNKNLNIEKGMSLGGCLLVFGLASMAGYVFYAPACVLVFSCLLSFLNERKEA